MNSPKVPQNICNWLPPAFAHKSKYNHWPLVMLMAFQLLEALLLKPDHGTDRHRKAHKMWSQYIKRQMHKLSDNAAPDKYRGRLLPNKMHHLTSVFRWLDALFFNRQLEGFTDLSLVDMGKNPEWFGRTRFDEVTLRCKIELAFRTNEGLFTGAEAMETIVSLLHEMIHAYILLQQCRCETCQSTPRLNGRSGHGNSWFYLVRLVEIVAQEAFKFPVPLKMDWSRVYNEEERLLNEDRRNLALQIQDHENKIRRHNENIRLGRPHNEEGNEMRARFLLHVHKMVRLGSRPT
ncbi:MAG: hypothetical protein Q9200_007109 [Gallowayella weberi]